MHVGRFPHGLLRSGAAAASAAAAPAWITSRRFIGSSPFGWIFSNRSQHLLQRLVVCNHHTTCGRGERQGSSSPTRRRCSATITVSGLWRACASSARCGCTETSIRSRARRSSPRRKAAKSCYRTSRPPGVRSFSRGARSWSRSCAARWTSARSTSPPRAARACSSRGRARDSFRRSPSSCSGFSSTCRAASPVRPPTTMRGACPGRNRAVSSPAARSASSATAPSAGGSPRWAPRSGCG